jgi:hypothetical protein
MSAAIPGPRTAGALLVGSAVLVNAAFLGLGRAFDYPQVLQQPAVDVLARFATSELLVGGLFTLLAVGAALLAPIALGLGRLAGPSRWARAAVAAGVAAAAVQVVGLLRWPLLVPGLAATATDPSASPGEVGAAVERFGRLGSVLGTVVGETTGYLLTAAFTLLVLRALRERYALPRVATSLALVSVPMILAGVFVPLGVGGAGIVTFAGYVLWSVWSIVLGVRLVRTATPGRSRAAASPQPVPPLHVPATR